MRMSIKLAKSLAACQPLTANPEMRANVRAFLLLGVLIS